MKTTYLYLVCLFFFCQLQAQNEWTKEELTKIKANIDLYEDILKVNSNSKTNDFSIQVTSVELIDKEIIISYTSQMPEGGTYFKPTISFRLNNKALNVAPENLFGAIHKEISFTEAIQPHQIIWTNLTKEYIDFKGELEITFSIETFGTRQLPYKVDCEILPTFTNKQKMPFIIAGLVGAASLTTGRLLERQVQEDYTNIYTVQKSEEAGEPIFLDLNNKHHNALIMTYTGTAILAVDAIWYFIRQRRYKKQLQTYNEFCNPKNVMLDPQLFRNIEHPNSLQPGIKLTVTFKD